MRPPLHVLARAVVYWDGSFLLARLKGADYTHLPGGHVESGEPTVSALERELLEELGLRCRVGSYLGAVEHAWKEEDVLQHEINHVFEVTVQSLSPPTPPQSREPNLDFLWSTALELEGNDLRPSVLIPLLRKWSAGDRSTGWASTIRE